LSALDYFLFSCCTVLNLYAIEGYSHKNLLLEIGKKAQYALSIPVKTNGRMSVKHFTKAKERQACLPLLADKNIITPKLPYSKNFTMENFNRTI